MSELSQKGISHGGVPVLVVFYNKLPWFVSELPEKDISNVVFLKKIPHTWWSSVGSILQ